MTKPIETLSPADQAILATALKTPLAKLGVNQLSRQLIMDKCGVSTRGMTVASSTQYQQTSTFVCYRDGSDVEVVFGNFGRSAPGASVDGPSTLTIRASISDGTNTFPLYSASGARDITIEPGARGKLRAPFFQVKKGQKYQITRLGTYSAATTTLYGWDNRFDKIGPVASEVGTGLTDKTLTPSSISGNAGGYVISDVVGITATGKPMPVVGLLGDSIDSDGTADVTNIYTGGVLRGLAAAGVPCVSIGISSLSFNNFLINPQAYSKTMAVLLDNGITHLLVPLGTNESPNLVSASVIYGYVTQLVAMCAPLGIKVIPATLPPRTATDLVSAPSENANWPATRATYNAQIVSANGAGYGYLDKATPLAGSGSAWRTDRQFVSAATVVAGGTGYAVGDVLFLPGDVQLVVASVSGTAIATVTVACAGAFSADPGVQSQRASYGPFVTGGHKNSSLAAFTGSGATFTYSFTTPTSAQISAEGVHPQPIGQSAVASITEAQAATLFTLG